MNKIIFKVFTILFFLIGSCNQKDDPTPEISLEIVDVYTAIEFYDVVYKTAPTNSITFLVEGSTLLYFKIEPSVPLDEVLITKTTGSPDSNYPISISSNVDLLQHNLRRSLDDSDTLGQLYKVGISTIEKEATNFDLKLRVFHSGGESEAETLNVSIEDPNFPNLIYKLEGNHEKDSIMIWDRFPFAFRNLSKDSVLLTLPHSGDDSYLGFELYNESEGLLYEYSAAYYQTNLTETEFEQLTNLSKAKALSIESFGRAFNTEGYFSEGSIVYITYESRWADSPCCGPTTGNALLYLKNYYFDPNTKDFSIEIIVKNLNGYLQ